MANFTKWFYGNEISEYGIQNKRVDYRTFASAFNHVLNNDIMYELESRGFCFELVNAGYDVSEDILEVENSLEDLVCEIRNEDDEERLEELTKLEVELENRLDELNEEREEQESQNEIFQYFIVDDNGADIIREFTNDPLFYCEEIDLYIWGITFYGTAWDYVLTDIPCGKEE